MRTVIRRFLESLLGLSLAQYLIGGFRIAGGPKALLFSAIVFGFINLFIKPILKLFFFPINVLSLGLLSWVVNVATLYLLTLIVPQITISVWLFKGLSYQGLVIPSYNFNQIEVFIITALVLSSFMNFIRWLYK